jgi:hypothetical protein
VVFIPIEKSPSSIDVLNKNELLTKQRLKLKNKIKKLPCIENYRREQINEEKIFAKYKNS